MEPDGRIMPADSAAARDRYLAGLREEGRGTQHVLNPRQQIGALDAHSGEDRVVRRRGKRDSAPL